MFAYERLCLAAAVSLGAIVAATPTQAADFFCNHLVLSGAKMICPGFEPNWAVELECRGTGMVSNFVDAFSGDGIVTTPGSVSFSNEDPWTFATSHGVAGSIAYTPSGCQDESDRIFNFTLTTTAVPGFGGQVAPICCRIE
jgi:hypothetical protein